MKGILAFAGTTIGSYAGWWLGSYVGLATSCLASVVGMGLGLYVARLAWRALNEEYL